MENYSKGLKFLDHYLILALKLNFNILSRKNKESLAKSFYLPYEKLLVCPTFKLLVCF